MKTDTHFDTFKGQVKALQNKAKELVDLIMDLDLNLETRNLQLVKDVKDLATAKNKLNFPLIHIPFGWIVRANAGLLSGSTGIEFVPGPDLPKIEFLNKFNEENQKRYAENDARFKDSPVLKELLEKSMLNKEKNKQAIQDKYCLCE
ncbi:hypothetical protein POM88_026806 [Heracleum sosnowskyi]|uniref:Uncharacterized protein n=1 Tax=Heracleum sosnowskyi TaxID=360622 RepID=A0AAD8I6J3_9APIA|nr:hypothetical protein POM88_026806 [Heracleum sosnowskyi]